MKNSEIQSVELPLEKNALLPDENSDLLAMPP